MATVPGFVSSSRFQTVKKLVGWLAIFMTFAAAITALTNVLSVPIGVYLLFVAIFVTFMHMKSLVQKSSIFQQENLISRCCNFVFSLDGIKLGIAYIVISIPTFIPGFTAVFPAFAGVVVLLLGICFVLQHFAPPSTEGNLPTSVPPTGAQYPQSGY
ncbi:hypothetical protein M514_13873 [Trichuris suis]|uniref:Uncharacterized protein n=1 Tax=Trichuris suis TaxID=68888 RepID=A0A085N6R1_9BILA|nr:hypothetical protein M513_13873 [Trichuris suis]KFD65157.1 hypothetical protein M514_13873 [Trichuris suis]KHJ44737.1 hypothetical protein D918_04972 [Trichuris suis]